MPGHDVTLSFDLTSIDRVRRDQALHDHPRQDHTRAAPMAARAEPAGSGAFLLDGDDTDIIDVEGGAEADTGSDAVRRLVVKHPVLAVISAVSTGYVVGRLLR